MRGVPSLEDLCQDHGPGTAARSARFGCSFIASSRSIRCSAVGRTRTGTGVTPRDSHSRASTKLRHDCMVPGEGLEPSRPFGHYGLNVARLPLRHPGMVPALGIEPRFAVSKAALLPQSPEYCPRDSNPELLALEASAFTDYARAAQRRDEGSNPSGKPPHCLASRLAPMSD